MPSIYLLIGYPASTKTTYAQKLLNRFSNGVILSRDIEGGSIIDLVPKVESLLQNNKIVIIDNTNLTKEIRKSFIKLAKERIIPIPIYGIYFKTTIEECQIRALHRMWIKYNDIYLTGKPPKDSVASKDPTVFPPAFFFRARKILEEPSIEEGFTKIQTIKVEYPKFDGRRYNKKALFLDIDGTIRKTVENTKYPVTIEQVQLLHDANKMKNLLEKYRNNGYLLIGLSNQSGISTKKITEEKVIECFNKTRELLGYTENEFPIIYCSHNPAPITCYCRKPQLGMPLKMIEQYKLNPKKCIMVGDMKTDQTMAERLKLQYIDVNEFWKFE